MLAIRSVKKIDIRCVIKKKKRKEKTTTLKHIANPEYINTLQNPSGAHSMLLKYYRYHHEHLSHLQSHCMIRVLWEIPLPSRRICSVLFADSEH